MEPIFSIITPTLNAETFIRTTLLSIKKQRCSGIEVIAVDGGSTDLTVKILTEFEGLNIKIIHLGGSSQTEAINEGIKHARGEILTWLNSDDILLPGSLQHVKKAFDVQPHIDIVYGSAAKIDALGNIIKPARFRTYSRDRLNSVYYITQPATFYKATLMKKAGGLENELEYAMDWDLMLRISNSQNTLSTDRELARLRIHHGTKTSLGGYARLKEIASISRKHFGFWNRNNVAFFCLLPFYKIFKSTDWNCFNRLGFLVSRVLDKLWGHMNYMVHYHSFEVPPRTKRPGLGKHRVPQPSQLLSQHPSIKL